MLKRSAGLVTVALLAVACQDTPTDPMLDGSATMTAQASTNATQVIKMDIVGLVVEISCTGDLLVVDGVFHISSHVSLNANGGFNVKFMTNPSRMKGTTLTSGDAYNGTGNTQEHFTANAGSTTTFVNNFRLIGKGQAPDLQVHHNINTTVNANGDVTASVDNVRITCS